MTPLPLAGRSVVVTRTGSRAEELTDPLERAGAAVLEFPLTAQVDPADGGAELREAATALGEHTWVVYTSVNAVERLLAEVDVDRLPRALQVAAVGPSTATALRAAGVEVNLVPSEHSAAGLVDAFPMAAPGAPRTVLFPAADVAPGTVVEGLTAKGWNVQRVEAYRTVALPAPEPARLAQVSAADAIVFTAASSVRAFGALRTPEGDPPQVPPLVVCIGATTAGVAREAGLHTVYEAPSASSEGIVAVLTEHLGSSGGGGS